MRAKIRAALEVVRVFLTPSSVADSLAGFSIAGALTTHGFDVPRFIALAATSISLYWFGMVTGDLFDVAKDRERAPDRPLVSGKLRVVEAIWIAAGLGCGAVGFSLLAGAPRVACCVLLAILAYNGGGKRVPLVGNLLMGSCRGGNLLMGGVAAAGSASILRGRDGQSLIAAAVIIGLYTAWVTAVSVLEDREYRPVRLHILATPLLAFPLLLGATRPDSSAGWINGILLLWLLLATQRRAASSREGPHPAAVYVRRVLGGIYLVDAGLVLAFYPPVANPLPTVASLYALAVLGWWWKRQWLQSDGLDT